MHHPIGRCIGDKLRLRMDALGGYCLKNDGMSIHPTPGSQTSRQPLPYHRLAREDPRSSQWWRPLTTLLVVALLLGATLFVTGLVVVVVILASEIGGLELPISDELPDDPTNPADLLLLFGGIAVTLPAIILGSRWGGGLKGAIHSVAGRLRWGMLLRAALVLMPLYLAWVAVAYLLDPPAEVVLPTLDLRTTSVFAVIVLVVPLQCAAEEYAFRALPQQMLGTWLRSPAWGIVLPVPLFMLGHGYDWAGQIDLAVFALCMGFLVWKSGGVELAIVAHTANNVALMLFVQFDGNASLAQGTTDPMALLVSVPFTLSVTAGLTWWVTQTHNLSWLEPVRRPARRAAIADTWADLPGQRKSSCETVDYS